MNKSRRNLFGTMQRWPLLLMIVFVATSAQAQTPATGTEKDNRSDTSRNVASGPELRLSALLAQARPAKRRGFLLVPSSSYSSSNLNSTPMAPASSAVHGTGTVGKLSMWVDTHPNGDSTLGDSIITQLAGNIGVGLSTPTSKLTVLGMIETTLGGYKFPDGTVQTTAAVSGLQQVFHDSTLQGDGTTGSPLGVAVPLVLTGSVIGASPGAIQVRNTARAGVGVIANGGQAGDGIQSFGGSGDNLGGGTGVFAQGGNTSAIRQAGTGVRAIGGEAFASGGSGGDAIVAQGGSNGGRGLRAFGGGSFVFGGTAGLAIHAVGGNSFQGAPGDGVVAEGGNSAIGFGGVGLIAKGGNSNGVVGGIGVRAEGGESGSTFGGIGLHTFGGLGTGSGHQGGYGIFAQGGPGQAGATQGQAGQFNGDVDINGNLSKSGGSFKIDHPLDPENKYLYHSFVESPDMKNIYDGTVTTDANGDATVVLPNYFAALNKDFRYQLTVIGTFAQAIVADEINDNHFKIKTNAANVKVSWQVTGIRQDAYANMKRVKVEEDKPERERGFYLHPEAINQPEERGIEWARHPEMMRQIKEARLKRIEESKQKASGNDR